MTDDPSGAGISPAETRPVPDGIPPSPPATPPKGWQDGIAPAFLTTGLSVVFLDRLAPTTLLVGGLAPAIVGAVLGGLLAYWCLYYAPAIWGVRTRRPLAAVAAGTFGTRGAVVVPGLLLAVVSVIWFALTIDYATQYTLGGLSAMGLVDPKHLGMNHRGPFEVPKPAFLAVAGAWSLASAVIGTLAIRLVAAVMSAYVLFPAVALGALAVWAMPTVASGPIDTVPFGLGGGRAIAAMIGLVFAFLACPGLSAADWGAATTSEADVRKGGIAGVMLGMPILAALSLLIVAGALGRAAVPAPAAGRIGDSLGPGARTSVSRTIPPRGGDSRETATAPTLREAIAKGVGGRIGGTVLLILALGLLGPACSNPHVIARELSAAWPGPPRWAWSVLGALATWPLIATGTTRRVEDLFGLIGGLAAPAAGAIAADYARARGAWPGPRRGVHLAGMAAWILGVAMAFAVARWGEASIATRFLPSSVAGFAAAFAAYLGLGAIPSRPSRSVPSVDGHEPGSS